MKLVVKTHKIKVVSDNREVFHVLDERFAITYPNYWFYKSYRDGTWDGKKHFFSLLTGTIPTGLFELLCLFLDKQGMEYTIEDLRPPLKKVEPITKLGRFDLETYPYDYQGKAVRAALEKGNGVLSMAVNSGKTIIAAAIIESLKLPALFVVTNKDLMYQAYDLFSEVLTDKVTMFGADTKNLGPITVAMAQSLVKALKRKPTLIKKYQIIFSDETHHLPSATLEAIFNKCPARYRFGLSGTPFDEHPVRDYRLISAVGSIVYEVRNKELVDRGVSARPLVSFIASKGKTLPSKIKYPQAVKLGIVYNEERNEQIIALIKQLQSEGKCAILVLSPRRKHGWELFNRMQELNMDVVFNHGSTPDFIRRESLQEFRERGGILMGSVIYDEGIDLPKMDVLILAGGGKAPRRLLQRVGRAQRKKEDSQTVAIYDFYDWQHKYLLKHSEQRLQTHLDEGFEIIPLEGTEDWIKSVQNREILENGYEDTSKPSIKKKYSLKPTLQERLKKLRKEK